MYETRVLDRVTDRARLKEYMNMVDYDFYQTIDSRWHLALLAVSVHHQRRGIGGRLVRHGQKLAAEDNVPMALESSVVGCGLYLKSGFKIVSEGEIIEGLPELAST